MGFTYLMSLPTGAAIYGIFQMVIGACSQQSRPRNGWLTDNGRASGRPWTLDDIALRFRRTVEEVKISMEALCSPRVGWIVELDQATAEDITEEYPPTTLKLPVESPLSNLEEKGIEEKGIERKGREGKAIRLLNLLNELTGKKFRAVESSLNPIMERLSECDVTEEGCVKMIRRQVINWSTNPEMCEYLRPETLFRKSKFNSYYAAKDQPANETGKRNTPERFDRNKGTFNEGKSHLYSDAARKSQERSKKDDELPGL